MKVFALVAVPLALLTLRVPVLVPMGTVARMLVADTAVTAVAAVPLKATVVPTPKPVPVMVTTVPTGPLMGTKLLMVGADGTVAAPVTATLAVRVPSVLPMIAIVVPAVAGAVNCTVTTWLSVPVALVVAVATWAKGAPPMSDTSTVASLLLMPMAALTARLAALRV